jgi:hypothetical protein
MSELYVAVGTAMDHSVLAASSVGDSCSNALMAVSSEVMAQ